MNQIHFDFLKRKATYKLLKKIKNIANTTSTPSNVNTLLVSTKHELSETMLYPFYWYEADLKKQGIQFCETITSDLVKEVKQSSQLKQMMKTQPQIKRIFFQSEFEMEEELLKRTLEYLQNVYPYAKIAFMDWYAPLHIRPSEVVNDYIDTYIKKQTYRNFSDYAKPTIGDTNLSDYYAKRHDLDIETMQFNPPEGIEDKIVLWSNFGLSPQMIDLFLGKRPIYSNRPIDLHARLAISGVPWYQAMRQESKDALNNLNLSNLNIASEGRVKRYKFFEEMTQSKLCFSPFGYGEICWRDYEAFATGSLLLKPNMDHLEVLPDIFVPEETYISLDWDFSDFEEKIQHYANDHTARNRIADNAFDAMHESIQSNQIMNKVMELF